jgi:hypothetical protein
MIVYPRKKEGMRPSSAGDYHQVQLAGAVGGFLKRLGIGSRPVARGWGHQGKRRLVTGWQAHSRIFDTSSRLPAAAALNTLPAGAPNTV